MSRLSEKIIEATKECPELEFLLSSKPLEECSEECQNKMQELYLMPFEAFHQHAVDIITQHNLGDEDCS